MPSSNRQEEVGSLPREVNVNFDSMERSLWALKVNVFTEPARAGWTKPATKGLARAVWVVY